MGIVDSGPTRYRLCSLRENVREKIVMQVNFGGAAILGRMSELDRDAVSVRANLEGGMLAERPDIGLVGKIDGNFCFVSDRLHIVRVRRFYRISAARALVLTFDAAVQQIQYQPR